MNAEQVQALQPGQEVEVYERAPGARDRMWQVAEVRAITRKRDHAGPLVTIIDMTVPKTGMAYSFKGRELETNVRLKGERQAKIDDLIEDLDVARRERASWQAHARRVQVALDVTLKDVETWKACAEERLATARKQGDVNRGLVVERDEWQRRAEKAEKAEIGTSDGNPRMAKELADALGHACHRWFADLDEVKRMRLEREPLEAMVAGARAALAAHFGRTCDDIVPEVKYAIAQLTVARESNQRLLDENASLRKDLETLKRERDQAVTKYSDYTRGLLQALGMRHTNGILSAIMNAEPYVDDAGLLEKIRNNTRFRSAVYDALGIISAVSTEGKIAIARIKDIRERLERVEKAVM